MRRCSTSPPGSSPTSLAGLACACATPTTHRASASTSTSSPPGAPNPPEWSKYRCAASRTGASAPYLYTAWCLEQPETFRRVVRFLKRWRDVHGDGSIASITLQVLAAETLAATAGSDAEALLETLRGMRERLAASPESAPVIANPVLPTEDLGDRWKEEGYRRFRVELEEAVALADTALGAAESES